MRELPLILHVSCTRRRAVNLMAASGKRGFGQLRRLPSRRWQAGYTGPDTAMHYAPSTFDTREDGEAWLAAERGLIAGDTWTSPRQRKAERRRPRLTFGTFAETWLAGRELKPRTRALYRRLLDTAILPALGAMPLTSLDTADVRHWYGGMPADRPTQRSHAYSLVRAIMSTAVQDGLVPSNPCRITGAGTAKRARKVVPASLAELGTAAHAMPEQYRLMVLLAAWCGLRFGELAELRRGDVDMRSGVLRVRRAVTRVDGLVIVGTPKSEAGIRDVAVPPHLLPAITDHLAEHVGRGSTALVFHAYGGQDVQLHPNTLYRSWHKARSVADRPDLRFHDLRHTGAVLAAQTGATLAELMERLGHSTPHAALRYQHAARGRGAAIAAALSQLAERDTPTP